MRLPQTPDGTSCDQAENVSMGTANKRESKAEEDMPGSPARFCGVFLWGKPCWDGGPLRAEQIWEAPLRVKPFMEVPLVQGICNAPWGPRMSKVPLGRGPHRKAVSFGFRLYAGRSRRLTRPRSSAKKAARVERDSTLAALEHSLIQLTEPLQHHRRLGPGGGALGVQPPVGGAVEDPRAAGPLQGRDGVLRHIKGVGVA